MDMGLFTRTQPAAFGAEPTVKAAAGAAGQTQNYLGYVQDFQRQEAIQNPTISRARDLLVSMVSGLSFEHYSEQWMGEDYEEIKIPNEPWMHQPDGKVTRQFILAWTCDDLVMHGRAYWYCTSRSSVTGKPLSFQWLPAVDVQLQDMTGPVYPAPSKKLTFNGFELKTEDVIQFLSPIQGLLSMGWRAIEIANRLDTAAMRFATNEITAGYLQQTAGSEPMDADDLGDLAAAWSAARKRNAIGALNSSVQWHEFNSDPSKLQLVEGREHQIRELANVANVPGYLVGAPAGSGMTYQNAQESQKALFLYGAQPYITCISQRLSMDDVIARGRYCKLNVDNLVGDIAMHDMNNPDMASMDNSSVTVNNSTTSNGQPS